MLAGCFEITSQRRLSTLVLCLCLMCFGSLEATSKRYVDSTGDVKIIVQYHNGGHCFSGGTFLTDVCPLEGQRVHLSCTLLQDQICSILKYLQLISPCIFSQAERTSKSSKIHKPRIHLLLKFNQQICETLSKIISSVFFFC